MRHLGLGQTFGAVVLALLLAGCWETSGTGPGQGVPGRAPVEDTPEAPLGVQDAFAQRGPELGACSNIALREEVKVAAHTYATGDQVYRWTGTSWVFVAPVARLHASANGREQVGTHYAGPTWESTSGSIVVGAVVDRCTADSNAIPWLLLQAVRADGPGIFGRITFIHRVNTVGGNAPATPGTFVGELANVPYTAQYYFYRAP
ncbi:MAG: DUF3455 domain-containing protein [Cytophagaceae bacterium]|nr:DUF3455 domain-containing protein [Gemmatimonadaceae bacterium]